MAKDVGNITQSFSFLWTKLGISGIIAKKMKGGNVVKRYHIAGLRVDMDVGGRTLVQAQPYEAESDGPADIKIRCNIDKVMEANPELGDRDMAEYMGTGTIFAHRIMMFDGFQLHSSAVMLDGHAYLFSAPSGTGKSTHTEKWCRLFGARLLNDDKPVLRYQQDKWIAYGTPWSGKHDLSVPAGVPLGGIAFLRRGQENTICRMEPGEAVIHLISQTPRYLTAEQMQLQLTLVDRLLQTVPVWLLTCRNDDEAAFVSYESMRCKA